MPLSSFFGEGQRFAGQNLNQEQKDALRLAGSLAAFSAVVPASTLFPYINSIVSNTKIKQQEAQRMFPGADPDLFDYEREGSVRHGRRYLQTIPLSQSIGTSRVFNKDIRADNLYTTEQFYPTYLTSQPNAPRPELGSYQDVVANKTTFPEESIKALTVTPAPNPSRFAKDYAEILADKLGKAHIDYEQFLSPTLGSYYAPKNEIEIEETIKNNQKTLTKLQNKIETLTNKIPGTAGYVWGNIDRPQYSYAEGNWGLGQKEKGVNPSIYVSQINADPLKEAGYLFTSNVLKSGEVDPRVKFKHYADLGRSTGPSYGIAPNEDISFRKDLIAARGELTTGDLQALLAERNLPFAYQTKQTNLVKRGDKLVPRTTVFEKPGDILRKNLETLAEAENITTSQAIEKFARLVPNLGEPELAPTPAVTGIRSAFPAEGQSISPSGNFASKTDLRQLGILPPADKASYTAFKVDEFDKLFKYVYPRYFASNIQELNTYTTPINPLDPFGEAEEGLSELIINRDKLRPQAANKLLNRTIEDLIKQSKSIKGLGLGGFATGSVATAADPAVIDALSRGDYTQAATTAAINTTVGSATGAAASKILQALGTAGYVRPAAAVAATLPAASGVIAGLGAVETGKALNRIYKSQTGKDWVTRNTPASPHSTYTGPTPVIRPRMGTAILNGKPIQVPYGSVAGERRVGRPWWDIAGSTLQGFADRLNRGSIIGR